ncbi:hypothetical protein QWI17_09020, partial [Gilvimarinus sp. SDUM040013]|uniref:hypothetical protein n=1 Tax=Gilvimarinus gilvus TaxID=3058038 RepID=UPI002672F36A
DADGLRLRVAEQFVAAPLALGSAEFKVQLCRRQWQAQQQRKQGKAMAHGYTPTKEASRLPAHCPLTPLLQSAEQPCQVRHDQQQCSGE